MGQMVYKKQSNSVILSVFRNEFSKDGQVVAVPNITIVRLYQKEGKWVYGTNFREKDIIDVKNVIESYLQKNEGNGIN